MFSRQKEELYLPGWLWFFLILPIVLIALLLYRQKRLPQILQRLRLPRTLPQTLPRPFNPVPRYAEPDSIPLEIGSEEGVVIVEEAGTDAEDVAIARATDAEEAAAAQDDLKIIEGIGPTIAGLLRDAGIVTFRQLAETQVERLNEILTNAGLRRLADPDTWPEQAALAAEGSWDTLKQLQNTLKGGRRSKTF